VSLRNVVREGRRPARLPDLDATATELEAPMPTVSSSSAAPRPTPAEAPTPARAPKPRPPAATASRPPAAGAQLDSLLTSLIANAPQVPDRAPPPPAATVEAKPESSSSRGGDERSESARPRSRFPWRVVFGVAGAAAAAAVTLAGVRGIGARMSGPRVTLDGRAAPTQPASNLDAWIAAQTAAGERVM